MIIENKLCDDHFDWSREKYVYCIFPSHIFPDAFPDSPEIYAIGTRGVQQRHRAPGAA
jgi:hypothetical protein